MATAEEFFNFVKLKIHNIVNKPLNNNIILKLTINYNYLRYNMYSNVIVLSKASIIKIQKFMELK